MNRKIRLCILFLSVSALTAGVRAEVKLHATLGDNMVLQQQSIARIHGTAAPMTKVAVRCSWDDVRRTTLSGPGGEWSVDVPTPSASNTPCTITVKERNTVTLSNVMIGEVWLCSGQSNMEMPMRGFPSQPVEGSLGAIISAPKYKNLRLFTVGRKCADTPQRECDGVWQQTSTQNVALFSAIGYMFGRNLNETLDIPVGIIVSSYGGSKVESWMSGEVISRYDTADYVPASRADVPYRAPSTLYNGMIAPLQGISFRGVLWYQGESNRSTAHHYARMLTDMIRQWRDDLKNARLPFLVCQICPYESVDTLMGAKLMEAQFLVVRNLPHTGIVGTSDLGSRTYVHAPKKAEVAERAMALALAQVYGYEGIPLSGPTFSGVEYREGRAIVSFDHVERGLFPEKTNLDCFQIAGRDRIFHPAEAVVSQDRKQVIVSSVKVADPVAVRFAFTSWHKTNLYNTEGLPAYPFRTDNW